MPVSFSRLRIAGFKSFAEPASVEIRPGLTGIVGPNGCGKSNVVEALRWAMGESRARSLRGGEMDDVIFAGTAARPSRNLAEVDADPGGDRRASARRHSRASRNCRSAAASSAVRAAPIASTVARRGRATCRRCSPTSRAARGPRRW